MLPLTLLDAAKGEQMLVELKNGDTYNGELESCDIFMNVNMKGVICTSRDGDRFWNIAKVRDQTIIAREVKETHRCTVRARPALARSTSEVILSSISGWLMT